MRVAHPSAGQGQLTDPRTPNTSGIPHLPRPFFAYFDHEPAGTVNVYVGTQGRGIWRIGVPSDGCVLTTAPPAGAIIGTSGPDNIAGTANDDVIFALEGDDNDQIYGVDGNDTLLGEGGADRLVGGTGNDTLIGGPDAPDDVSGGDGDDVINVQDGVGGERYSGGPHVTGDTCLADGGDIGYATVRRNRPHRARAVATAPVRSSEPGTLPVPRS